MLTKKMLEEILIKEYKIKAVELKKYQTQAKKIRKTIEQFLLDEGIIDELELYSKAAANFEVPFITLKGTEIKKDVLNLVPAPLAQTHNVIAFDKNKEDLRDKTVLSFDRNSIVSIAASLPGGDFRLQASSQGDEISWESSDGRDWDAEVIDDLLDRLDDFACESFIEDEGVQMGEPQLVLELQGQERHTLTLFQKNDEGYVAQSSYTPYTFYISNWQGDSILKPFAPGDEQ